MLKRAVCYPDEHPAFHVKRKRQPITSVGLLRLSSSSRLRVLKVYMHVAIFLYSFISLSPQNLQWARDVLLGSGVPWQQLKHMPAQGLFCERNKTNLFNVSQNLLLMFFMEKVGFYWESSDVASPCVVGKYFYH